MMKKKRKKSKIHWIMPIILTFLLMMNCGKKTALSDDLFGIWKTSDTKYEEAYFELQRNMVIFGTRDGDINGFPILKVKKEKFQDKAWMLYTIFYETNDFQKMEFTFYYHAGTPELIRFKNQPSLVWQKTTIEP